MSILKNSTLEIILKYQKVRDYIGDNISDDEIHNILHALNMGIKKIEQESLKVSVPTNKVDVSEMWI
ncbi:MAG: hypothetical protein IPL23_10815 [Saprospiraceae bacterium]|nr:hypothetical protein [Saprospiraceae bacterium]